MADETRNLIAAGIAALQRAASTPVAPYGYGRDLVCVGDLTPNLEETDPNTIASLAQDIYHRITTERGSLVDDPDFGEDVRGYLSAAMTDRMIVSIAGRLELEIKKDDRVRDVTVGLSWAAPVLDVVITVTVEDAALTQFEMVLAVTSGEALLLEISRGV